MRNVKEYLSIILTVVMLSIIAVNSQTIKQDNLSPKAGLEFTAPSVVSITRVNANPTRWYFTVSYAVTFSEPVSGVDINDFALTTTGDIAQAPPNNPLALPQIRSVSGSGTAYNVVVYTGAWGTQGTKTGTLRLDLIDNDSITNQGGEFLGGAGNGSFTTGEAYDVQTKRLLMRIEQNIPSNAFVTQGYFADPNVGTPCSAITAPQKINNATAPTSTTRFARLTQYQETSYFGNTYRFLEQENSFLLAAEANGNFSTFAVLSRFGGNGFSRPANIIISPNSRERITYNTEDDSFYYGTRIVNFPRYTTFHLNFSFGGWLDYTPNGDGTYTWTVVGANGSVTTFTTIAAEEMPAPPTLDEPDLLPSRDNGINPCDNVIGFNTNLPFKFFADPGAEIQLLRDDAVVATETANANGEGLLTDAGTVPDGPHAYSLRQIVNGSPRDVSYQPTNVIVRSGPLATVTINQAEGQSDPATTSPVNFTVVFSEPVTDFDANDVVLSGTAISDFNFQKTVTGSGAVYNVAVGTQNTRRNGTLSVSVPATTVTGTSAVTNLASTSTDNIVTVNMPDSDGDGVPNAFDACQTSAPGATINETGCEIRQCVPPLAGLIDWYAGNDGLLNLASGQSGFMSSGVTFTQGKVGRAFSFNGAGTVFSAPTAVGLSPMTYIAWIRPGFTDAAHDTYYRPRISNVVSTNSPYYGGHGFGADISTGGGSVAYALNPQYPSRQDAFFGYNFAPDAWYHVAVTYSPLTDATDPDGAPIKLGETKVYINGSLVSDTGMTRVVDEVFRNSFRIGGRDPHPVFDENGHQIFNPFEFFKGQIDEVQVYNRELGDYEVRAIARADNYGICQPAGVAPVVNSVTRSSGQNNLSPNANIDVSVAFSKPVTGVDATDFVLTTTGNVSGVSVTSVSGSGSSRIVSINRGTGAGTVRLDIIDDDTIIDAENNPLGGTGNGNGNFTAGEVITLFPPTAASVNISGRVADSSGRCVSGVTIYLMDANGDTRTARSNSFGFYRFAEVQVGATYIISPQHKRYDFTPQVLNVIEELNDLNFVAQLK
jgi:hypothetical protein